jgi:hypothetical protein
MRTNHQHTHIQTLQTPFRRYRLRKQEDRARQQRMLPSNEVSRTLAKTRKRTANIYGQPLRQPPSRAPSAASRALAARASARGPRGGLGELRALDVTRGSAMAATRRNSTDRMAMTTVRHPSDQHETPHHPTTTTTTTSTQTHTHTHTLALTHTHTHTHTHTRISATPPPPPPPRSPPPLQLPQPQPQPHPFVLSQFSLSIARNTRAQSLEHSLLCRAQS